MKKLLLCMAVVFLFVPSVNAWDQEDCEAMLAQAIGLRDSACNLGLAMLPHRSAAQSAYNRAINKQMDVIGDGNDQGSGWVVGCYEMDLGDDDWRNGEGEYTEATDCAVNKMTEGNNLIAEGNGFFNMDCWEECYNAYFAAAQAYKIAEGKYYDATQFYIGAKTHYDTAYDWFLTCPY